MGDIIILVMVASPCQVSGNVRLKSFIITVTVPYSPLMHSTRTDSGRVADTNVQTARRYPSPMRLCTNALQYTDIDLILSMPTSCDMRNCKKYFFLFVHFT